MAKVGLYEYDVQVVSLRRGGPANDDSGTLTVTDTSDGAITLYGDAQGLNVVASPLTLTDGRRTFWTATTPIKIVAAVTAPITQTITATNWTRNDHRITVIDPIS